MAQIEEMAGAQGPSQRITERGARAGFPGADRRPPGAGSTELPLGPGSGQPAGTAPRPIRTALSRKYLPTIAAACRRGSPEGLTVRCGIADRRL